jgi:SAM-dependent methyltransferase
MLTAHDWHSRYLQQAGWTRSLRHFILRRLDLQPGSRILEIGCGTGAVTSDLAETFQTTVHGLDINFTFVELAKSEDPKSRYLCGNALSLPYPADCFDVVICHFFLLWMREIPSILREMQRVTKSGGTVAALAEPDYGGRIDFPDSLNELGQWQAFALGSQGANPNVGRRLMAEFIAAGLDAVESGLMGGQWKASYDKNAFDQEWKIIESDLSVMVSPARLSALRRMDEVAHRKGERILFVPTFYTFGKTVKP